MARVTASSGNDYSTLEAERWYRVKLTEISQDTEGKFGTREVFKFDIINNGDTDISIAVKCDQRMGKNPAGGVARLRAVTNALAGRSAASPMYWWDDETHEAGETKDSPAFVRIVPGMECEALGDFGDGDEPFFVFRKFRPVTTAATQAAAATLGSVPF